jgi:hypothetical protein
LDLIDWGHARLFIEAIPIPNLVSFRFSTDYEHTTPIEDVEILDAAVRRYGSSMIELKLEDGFVSPANLVNIAKYCLSLEKFSILMMDGKVDLSLRGMKIIASLPRLRCLKIGDLCEIEEGSVENLDIIFEELDQALFRIR